MNLKNWQCLSSIPVLGGIINSFSDKLAGFIQSGFLHLHVGNLDCINSCQISQLGFVICKDELLHSDFLVPSSLQIRGTQREKERESIFKCIYSVIYIFWHAPLCKRANGEIHVCRNAHVQYLMADILRANQKRNLHLHACKYPECANNSWSSL